MSDVQQYLLMVDNDRMEAEKIAKATADKLESRRTTLIEVVHSLGEYINNEDLTLRSKTVTYLALVIGLLQETALTRQQVQVLCQFFCDRIEDGGAIEGLLRLQGQRRFNQEMAIMSFRALIEHFQDLMIRPQLQRLQILELLNGLMLNHRGALKKLGDESLVGITDLVSGEKDPRNLMVIFSVLKVIMVEWDISRHVETLFDSIFCYFPITFRPQPHDPYGITASDLKTRLRDCIAASSLFAPHAFPQLIDKLDSTSPNVKKDVLQTLAACVSTYKINTVSNYSTTLWNSLKYEILNAEDEDLAEDALAILRAVAVHLGNEFNTTQQPTLLARYLKPILQECNEQLKEPQHKQAKATGRILRSLAASSWTAMHLLVKELVPLLFTLYQDADSLTTRRALLEVLVQLLDAAVALGRFEGTIENVTTSDHPLLSFKEQFFELFSSALMSTAAEEVSFQVVALEGLLRLCQIRNFLQSNEIGMAVQYCVEKVLSDESVARDDLRNQALQALAEISKFKPNLIMEITFPALMARLPDSSHSNEISHLFILDGLARVSVEQSISDTLVRRLLSKLDLVLQNRGSASYPQAILSTLDVILCRQDLADDPNLSSYHERIVVGLVKRAASVTSSSEVNTALDHATTLEILGRLVARIIRALDEHKRESIALQTYTLFVEEDSPFTPVLYAQSIPEKRRLTMILSTWILASVGTAAALLFTVGDRADLQPYLTELTRLALVEPIPLIRHYILRQIALIVNKFSALDNATGALQLLRDPTRSLHEHGKQSLKATPVIFWIAKALLMRSLRTEEVLEHVLGLLSDSEQGAESAKGFALLLSRDEILSKENGVVDRLLAKQKVFNICVPRIVKDFKAASASEKPNYLVALSGILRSVSAEVMMTDIGTLLPLLLQSLDLENQHVKAASIESLLVVCQENPSVVEGHVSGLVSRLLQSATEIHQNIPRVRYYALKCLAILPITTKRTVVLPLKSRVTRGIMVVLDDPKRNVRKAAVDCRAVWSDMDEIDDKD